MKTYNNQQPPWKDPNWTYTKEADVIRTWIKHGYKPTTVFPNFKTVKPQ